MRWAEVTRAMTNHAVAAGDSVAGLISAGSAWGIDGLVCSAHELVRVKELAPSLYTVVPGIRPRNGSTVSGDDQSRVMTPQEAAKAGARSIVVGRPITQDPQPRQVVQRILADLS
jgi:orotidine-5'-phosphate decarboxylase